MLHNQPTVVPKIFSILFRLSSWHKGENSDQTVLSSVQENRLHWYIDIGIQKAIYISKNSITKQTEYLTMLHWTSAFFMDKSRFKPKSFDSNKKWWWNTEISCWQHHWIWYLYWTELALASLVQMTLMSRRTTLWQVQCTKKRHFMKSGGGYYYLHLSPLYQRNELLSIRGYKPLSTWNNFPSPNIYLPADA